MTLKANSQTRLRLRVTATAESIIRSGHPWIFADSVLETNRTGQTGELAVIFDRKDKFLAIGFFDADSPIRVRILHVGKPQTIDSAWWQAHLEKALAYRRALFDAQTNGLRLINGESDGWPGLVLDQYTGTLVLKIYTAAWLPLLNDLVAWFTAAISTERMVLRMSRNIQAVAEKQFQLQDGDVPWGRPPEGPVIFSENGIRFEADVLRGQKTGFFLDQRENRAEVGKLAAGKTVLNAFSFSGGFSLYAARGGAKTVTDLDISAHALESARRNFQLNQHLAGVAACRHETIQADTFEWLPKGAEKFDLIILDPPSMAKRAAERDGAIRAYERLNSLGITRLEPGGILVAGSCSAQVSASEFFEAVRRAAQKSGRKFSELKTLRHASDHHATFKEGEYLKMIYLKFT